MPTELAGSKSNEGPAHSERHADLIRLASCIEPTAVKEQPFRASLFSVLDYAEQTGPLFGKHAIESVRDWANAAMAASVWAMGIAGSAPSQRSPHWKESRNQW